jgi:competence protein ComEC
MISMVITGNTFSRYINTLNILALSAFILLLYNPLLVADVGFQLSYLAVFGLVVFQPLISNWFEFKHQWANKLWYLISASIAAQLITFPLSGYYFHQFPVYFLLSNLFIIIPSEIIMLVGIVYLLLPSIPLLSPLLAYALEQSIVLMNKGLALIEHAPYSSFKQVWLSIPDCLLIFTASLLFFDFVHYKKTTRLRLSLICLLLACTDVAYSKIKIFRNDSITFLNLRKHTGILLKKGDEAVLITDVKPADKAFTYSIKPCLDSNRISNLHCINPDSDIQTNWFCKRASLVQFKTSRLVLINKYVPVYAGNIKADYLFITGNAKVSSADLKTYEPAIIIANADNRRLDTEKLKQQAASLHLNFFSLRSNKALEVASN